jgi:hypothetical protein
MKLGMKIHGALSVQSRGTAPNLDIKEPMGYTFPDLLSLHTIDNGVEHWWYHHIKIG